MKRTLSKLRQLRHLGETGLGLFRESGEDHGDVIAGMLAAGTRNDYAIAMHL